MECTIIERNYRYVEYRLKLGMPVEILDVFLFFSVNQMMYYVNR
jgi:hypothetical protein